MRASALIYRCKSKYMTRLNHFPLWLYFQLQLGM
jgi:hypothetical protein